MSQKNSIEIYPYSAPFALSNRLTFMTANITLTVLIYGGKIHRETYNDAIVSWRDPRKNPTDSGGVVVYGFYTDNYAACSFMLSKGMTAKTAYESIDNGKSFDKLRSHGLILRR